MKIEWTETDDFDTYAEPEKERGFGRGLAVGVIIGIMASLFAFTLIAIMAGTQ